jgi:hypothetical protein
LLRFIRPTIHDAPATTGTAKTNAPMTPPQSNLSSSPMPSRSRSLNGKGAFRRFRNELYEHHPELISDWQSFREARARARAVHWLVEQGLVEEDTARRFTNDHPEPNLP